MEEPHDTKKSREFGLTIGIIGLIYGAWPLAVSGSPPRLWALALAASLIVLALAWPQSLSRPSRYWFRLAGTLGRINSCIILAILFYVIITPIGLMQRWWTGDPLGRRFDREADTYRVRRSPRPPGHMRHGF